MKLEALAEGASVQIDKCRSVQIATNQHRFFVVVTTKSDTGKFENQVTDSEGYMYYETQRVVAGVDSIATAIEIAQLQ